MAAHGSDVGAGTPLLRVVSGNPSAEEVAALVAVLAARASAVAARPARPTAWADRRRLVRRPLATGPGAWRTSAWPG